VLGGTLVNLGDLDQDVLKRVLDAHVAERGHPMPAKWIATGDGVIVIPDEEDEVVNEEGVIPRSEEEPGSSGEPAGGREGEPLGEIPEDGRSEFVNDQMWEELFAKYCRNIDAGNQIEGPVMADEQNREGDGDRRMEKYGEGAMGVAITDEEWEQLVAQYCREVERGTEGQIMTNLGDSLPWEVMATWEGKKAMGLKDK